jgi:hypothetical protein
MNNSKLAVLGSIAAQIVGAAAASLQVDPLAAGALLNGGAPAAFANPSMDSTIVTV